tara:strand:- start:7111 stop:8388 length:1278 start_codon:yes stop_codon:yes gene_type:complete
MLDIKFIRDNAKAVKENIKKKNQNEKVKLVDELLILEKKFEKLQHNSQVIRTKRNTMNQEINKLKKEGKDIKKQIKEAQKIPKDLEKNDKEKNEIFLKMREILLTIPNMMHKSVPLGKDEKENVVREKIGKPKKFNFKVVNHSELLEKLDLVDFDAARKVAGNGFFYLKGDLVKLNQALIQFGIDIMVEKGFTLVEPPLMINKEAANGVVDFEFFKEMIYKIEGEDLHLIATSEHPLIAMFIGKQIDAEKLPIKIVGVSQCFRKEIGSHGIDEKGLFRTHQFNKVEQIVICKPEDSYTHYDEMLNISKEIFKRLEIPTRVLECCSGDLADLKTKSADLEAYSPRKDLYFEICSVSNLTDAQSRRLNIRVRKGNEKYFAHTLNNTAIATSRAMVAILENFQTKEGTVKIPKALHKYMNGVTELKKR